MEKSNLQLLEETIDILIQTCKQQADENKILRKKEAALISENKDLREKNQLARTRVESMIERLKTMEINS
ncbi:MAG: TIGR02449 family protein [Thiomargarita sp.]|nr:TIGR02449 family protein [Thiomargarita sp.]